MKTKNKDSLRVNHTVTNTSNTSLQYYATSTTSSIIVIHVRTSRHEQAGPIRRQKIAYVQMIQCCFSKLDILLLLTGLQFEQNTRSHILMIATRVL